MVKLVSTSILNIAIMLLITISSLGQQAQQSLTAPITDPTTHERLVLPVPANPRLPSLFLVGDSTVRNGHGDGANGQWGWGEPLVDYFDSTKINVVNRAIGGRSSRTYITEGHWQETLNLIKSGDFVLFQFGHNDSGPLDDAARARGTLPGVGEETQEIDNPILKRHETVHTYGWYMRKYVSDTLAKGATPIICSPVPRKIWKEGKVLRNSENYGGWAKQVAQRERVAFIDLNEIISIRYEELGEEKVEALFADPHTHTSRAGAELNAECVVAGLKSFPKDALSPYLSAKGRAMKPFTGFKARRPRDLPSPTLHVQYQPEFEQESDLSLFVDRHTRPRANTSNRPPHEFPQSSYGGYCGPVLYRNGNSRVPGAVQPESWRPSCRL